jgi:phosphoribosylamine--glycine ligase
MGAYSPVSVMTDELLVKIKKEVLEPTIRAMSNKGCIYQGILYAGLMITNDGPKVLEYNVRFGDPETQAVLTRMTSDLLDPIIGAIDGNISKCKISWTEQACACIVIASGGYPDKYEKGYEIEGLDSVKNSIVFHAGTKLEGKKIITSGGRVLGVTALGDTIFDAVNKGYEDITKINFKGMHYRRDIGKRSISK